MKKLLLSISLLCFGALAQVQAQSFLTSSGTADTVAKGYEPGDIFVYNYLKSNTGGDMILNWRVADVDTSNGWHFIGFCDNDLCYNVPAVLTGSYNPVYGTEFDDFHAVFNGDDATVGTAAWVTIKVVDPNTSDTRNLTFIAYKSPTGVVTTPVANNTKMWPNPATTAVNVSFNPNAGISNARVYNTIGKLVGQYRVQGSSAKLDISNLPSGVYMLRLSNAKGAVVDTKRFTVK